MDVSVGTNVKQVFYMVKVSLSVLQTIYSIKIHPIVFEFCAFVCKPPFFGMTAAFATNPKAE